MTLLIDTVPTVFIKLLRARNSKQAFLFDGIQRKKEEKGEKRVKKKKQVVWELFLKRRADECCIAQLGKQGEQTGTHS